MSLLSEIGLMQEVKKVLSGNGLYHLRTILEIITDPGWVLYQRFWEEAGKFGFPTASMYQTLVRLKDLLEKMK